MNGFVFAMMGAAGGGQAGGMASMLPFFIIFFAIFYFLIIRPQQKRQKQFEELIASLKEYDRVVTSGGIYGTITSVKDKSVVLKIAEGVKIEVNKGNVATVLTENKTENAAEKK